jgi:type I restriction enzyme, S subunit
MMREDWIEVELGELTENPKNDIVDGPFGSNLKSDEYVDIGIPVFKIQNIKANRFVDKNIHYVTPQKSEELKRHTFKKGDLIITKLGDPLGLCCKVPEKYEFGVIVADLIRFRSSDRIVFDKYLIYGINSILIQKQFKEITKGTTRPRVNLTIVRSLKFPLAPLPEQRAIAAKIEQLFSELDNGIANLKTAKSKLEIYRQAILKQAFEGKLTEQWREKESKIHGNHVNQKNHSTDNLPETWKQVKVGDICECIVPNRDKPKSFNGNIFWITTPDLNEENIHINYSLIDKGLTKDEVIEYKAKVIPINSVIMTCVGKFGVTALIEKESVINQQLHAFLPNDNVVPKYLAYALKTQKDYMHRVSTAITISYLNKSNCNSVPINLPPTIEEQTQIVQEIETRLSVCDKLNEAIEQSLEKAQALRQSILKKAFEGKLLSQDELQTCRQQPDWEPAAKLLERIENKKNK